MTGPIIDAHAHFFPQRMFEAIWKYFAMGNWPIYHRGEVEELPGELLRRGVARYTVLNYVKQPGQARELNQWTADFAKKRPEALPFGTVHVEDPDPWATVAPFLEQGFYGVKLQPLVSEFGVDDPRLRPVLAGLQATNKILVVHAGTAPYANAWVGLERLSRALADFPDLTTILPHMGAYQVEKAFALLERFPRLYLDTTMIFVNTGVFNTKPRIDFSELERFADRILFGSDFPNIPYAYSESIASLERLPISEGTRHKIFFENAARLFQL